MKNTFNGIMAASLAFVVGCETTGVQVTRGGDSGGYVSGWSVSARDQLDAANDLVSRFLTSPQAARQLEGGKRIIGVSRIVNNTTTLLYSNILTDNVIQALQESGKCYATATFNYEEVDNDPLVMRLRKLRASGEVDQSTVPKPASLKAPDLTLKGSITEDISRNGRNIEKTFVTTLQVVDVNTGLLVWSGQYYLSKQGKGGIRTW